MSDSLKYDVFISYARDDGLKYAEELELKLQSAGFKTWRDKRQLDPHQDFTAMIEDAIENSRAIVGCITPDVRRQDSFVRRELQYGMIDNKPIIPLLMNASARLPIHIVNLTYIDFTIPQWDDAFNQLTARLTDLKAGKFVELGEITPPDDPFREYCNLLYKQIVAFLNHTVFSMLPAQNSDALITLQAKDTPDAVSEVAMQEASALPLQFLGMVDMEFELSDNSPKFHDFSGAFEHYDGRVLLLGEPGAGKTTTLFAFARDAISRRLNDPAKPLPILLPVISWNAEEKPSLLEWVTSAVPAFKAKYTEVETIITDGKALLLLDGLDELGDRREKRENDPQTGQEITETYDPRPLFIDTMVDVGVHGDMPNKMIISCRIKDYRDIITKNDKIPLDGAVTLQPLNDEQLQIYLRDLPELWDALNNDDDLRDVARTPLLLSLFTYAFSGILEEENSAEALEGLRTLKGGALRDKIFRTYIERRYKHEEAKYKHRGETPPFTVEQIYETLGHVAMIDASRNVDNQILRSYFQRSIIEESVLASFIDFSLTLHLLVGGDVSKRIIINYDNVEIPSYHFIHLLLRDYLVYDYCIPRLGNKSAYLGFIGNPAQALATIQDIRSTNDLINALKSDDPLIRRAIVQALEQMKIADRRVFGPLLRSLRDNHAYTRESAVKILGNLGGSQVARVLTPLLYDRSMTSAQKRVNHTVRDVLWKIGTDKEWAAIQEAEEKGWLD